MLLRSTLIYGPAILLTRLSALVLLIIVTRLINQTEYGLLTLVVTVGEMTDIAVTNWLRISLLRLGGKGDISRGSVILASKVLVGTTALALAISSVASMIVVPERWQQFALAVGAYLVAGSMARFSLTLLQMQQRHSTYSLLECLRAFLQLILPIGVIFLVPDSFLAVSIASSSGMLGAGVAAMITAARHIVEGPPRFTARDLFVLGVPIVVLACLAFGLNNAERLFLNAYYNASAVAIFAAAYILARQPIDMVANAINMGAFPEVVSRFDEQGAAASGELLSQLMALLIRLCLPVAAMLVALSGEITGFLLPVTYHGRATLLFPIICFSVMCANVTSFVYGAVVYAHKRPWLLFMPTCIGSVTTIGLSVLIIPKLAELGAAMALAGGSTVALAGSIVVSRRLTVVPVPWRDVGISIVISLATGGAASAAAYTFEEFPDATHLIAGGGAGAATFLTMIWFFHPEEAKQSISKLRVALGLA